MVSTNTIGIIFRMKVPTNHKTKVGAKGLRRTSAGAIRLLETGREAGG